MRPMLQLLFGVFLTLGLSTSAHAVGFDLTFANPGADCANEATLATDCMNGIDVVDPTQLTFDLNGGVQLIVNGVENITSLAPLLATRAETIQDFPDLGGLAVNVGTDQVEQAQGLLFRQSDWSAFLPYVSFTDDHAAIDPDAIIGVAGYIFGTLETTQFLTASALESGALLGENPDINRWLFYNRSADGPTWYVSSMSTIPEPGTAALLGFGLTGLAARRRKTLA